MKKLSTFDIVMIVLFVLISGAGFTVLYYYQSQLWQLQTDIQAKQQVIDQSVTMGLTPSVDSIKKVDDDIKLIHSEIDPLIETKLKPSSKNVSAMTTESATVWRQHLDDVVTTLKNNARTSRVEFPDTPKFYFGFSRFISSSPRESQTATLNKQLYAIQTLAQKAIDLKLKAIVGFKRTFDEDQVNAGGMPSSSDKDCLLGYSQSSKSGTYHAYPIEFVFECSPTQFREFVNQIATSTDIFVIRSIQVTSSKTDSYKQSELSALAGPPPAPPQDTSPGAVAAAPSMTKGPSYIFGNEYLQVRMRVDLIEWLGLPANDSAAAATPRGNR